MKVIIIPNLPIYQHYKQREGLPWIKWHRKCLIDHKFCQLTDAERWLFIGLVLLATDNNNQIPFDMSYIARKVCYFPPEINENGVTKVRKVGKTFREVSHGILKMLDLKLIASKRIAQYYQDAIESRVDKIREEKNVSFNQRHDLRDSKEVLKEKMKWKL